MQATHLSPRPLLRRPALRLTAALAVAAAAALAASAASLGSVAPRSSQTPPPNLVVFLVDDMGWQDTSVPFHSERTPLNERYRTPHMERLAARGKRFTQAYVSSICSPTRVSLMTGLNAARHRVTSWTLRRDKSTDAKHPHLTPPAWNVNGLSPEPSPELHRERAVHARALPDYLRAAGYRTIHVGKAHFGAAGTPGADPRRLGFDVNIAGHAAGAPGSYSGLDSFSGAKRNPSGDRIWDVPGLEPYHGHPIHLTEALTREAVREVRAAAAASEPFLLYLAHYAVHTPIQPDPAYVDGYPELDPIEAAYASLIEGMDASLGAVLDVLDELELTENTVVLFLSDNGGLTHVARGGEPYTHNLPLSSGKGSAHEGGTRVPLIASWPGVTEPGSRCATPVIVEDVLPTLLALAGLAAPSGIDGVSFTDLLGDTGPAPAAERSRRPLVWHQPNHWATGLGLGPHSAIRVGDWKLVHYYDPERPEPVELFHLASDLGERHNLAVQEPERREALAAQLRGELLRLGAQRPRLSASGQPAPWPGAGGSGR